MLSLLLFNAFSEGIILNREHIINLRYADNTVLLTFSQESLQIILARVSENYNFFNIQKTKVPEITKL